MLRDGVYEIQATLDNGHREVLHYRVDASPAHTAVIEVGNGVISLTEGRGHCTIRSVYRGLILADSNHGRTRSSRDLDLPVVPGHQ